SLLGIVCLLGLMVATSRDRRSIPWYTVGTGLFLQFLIALFVLKTSIGQQIFKYISTFIATFLGFSEKGGEF
ncbi:concentrative nucleoside transporter N-terminal domain-containing protein, partial [Globomyces pollinis-pini]